MRRTTQRPGGRRPIERAVRMHPRGQVDDVGLAAHGVGRGHGRGGHGVDAGGRREGRFLLEAIDRRGGMEKQLGHGGTGRCGWLGRVRPAARRLRRRSANGHAEETRGDGRECDGARSAGNRRDGVELPAIVARFQFRGVDTARGLCPRLPPVTKVTPEMLWGLREFDLDPGLLSGGAAGRREVVASAPPASAARSNAPPLEVTLGCSSASVRSLSGAR